MRTQFWVVRAWLTTLVHGRRHDDRGDVVEKVIMIAVFAAAAIVVAGILVAKAKSAAESVKTQ